MGWQAIPKQMRLEELETEVSGCQHPVVVGG
jgi:hypothetical protein